MNVPTYEDVVEALRRRGQYREADAVWWECPALYVEATERNLRYDLRSEEAIEAAERVLREEF